MNEVLSLCIHDFCHPLSVPNIGLPVPNIGLPVPNVGLPVPNVGLFVLSVTLRFGFEVWF